MNDTPTGMPTCNCEAEVHMGVGFYHHPWCATRAVPAGRDALRDRIAEALAGVDGWKWADGFKEHSPSWQRYQHLAAAVLAVLPPPADRAAVLHEAADAAENVAIRLHRAHDVGGSTGAYEAMEELRRLADEERDEREAQAHFDQLADELAAAIASCPGAELSPNPCRCPCYGCKHHCGAHDPSRMAVEAQQQTETPAVAYRSPGTRALYCVVCARQETGWQPVTEVRDGAVCDFCGGGVLAVASRTLGDVVARHLPAVVAAVAGEAEAHPPTHTWKVESPRRDQWASWGATHDERVWAAASYDDAIEHGRDRPFRLVRATTTYTVEAEHTPKEA